MKTLKILFNDYDEEKKEYKNNQLQLLCQRDREKLIKSRTVIAKNRMKITSLHQPLIY